MAKVSLDLFVMSCWLSIAVLLLSVYHARAAQGGVRECERITIQDLRSRNNFLQSSILVQTYNPNVNPTNPFIVVNDMHIVCEASAATRDRYRYVSVVVSQTCSGSLCTTEADVLVQYDFECSTSNEWIAESFGRDMEHIREDDPEADFDTEPLYNCSACAADLSGADSVTHCLPCSGCDEGLMLCDGRLGTCCTYYFEDMCVEECPEECHVVDEDFNCVKLVDCGELMDPENGAVNVTNTTFNSTATYSCNDGYSLVGDTTITCLASASWSGNEPSCCTSNCIECDVDKCSSCKQNYKLESGICRCATVDGCSICADDDSSKCDTCDEGLRLSEDKSGCITPGAIVGLTLREKVLLAVTVVFGALLIALAVTVVVLGLELSKKNSRSSHASKNDEIEVDENCAYATSTEAFNRI